MTVETVQVPVYRPFAGQVSRLQRLSPSFLRVTFTGLDFDEFASNGLDQRIKVMLPLPGRGIDDCPSDPDWYGAWRALPADRRMPLRTYTVRGVRPDRREVDVDFVLHGDGPAAAWAAAARPGAVLAVAGAASLAERPAGWLLLAGDETSLPAISRLLAAAPPSTVGVAFLEVAGPEEEQPLAAPPGIAVHWLHRNGTPPGEGTLLVDAVAALEPPGTDDVFAWVGAESAAVRAIRADLRGRWGLGRAQHHAIGYWRRGRAMAPAG